MFLLLRPQQRSVIQRRTMGFGLTPRILRWPAKVIWWLFNALLRGIPDIARQFFIVPILALIIGWVFRTHIKNDVIETVIFLLSTAYIFFFKPNKAPSTSNQEDSQE